MVILSISYYFVFVVIQPNVDINSRIQIIKKMPNIFVVRHKQPQDVPFQRSASYHQITMKKYQNTAKLTSIVVLICMSTFYYGVCLSMISAINDHILHQYFGDWAATNSTIGLLIGFFPIGGAIGAVSARLFIKYLTRRQILLVLDVAAIITTGLLQIPNIGLLLALRIVQGFIVGSFMAVVPLFVNELVPIDLHGSEGVISQILIVVGVVIDYVWKSAFTGNVNTEFHWRFVFAFTGLPCIVQLIFILLGYVPQSPMSLIQRGKIDKAKAILAEYNIKQVLNDVVAQMIHTSKKAQLKKIANQHGVTYQSSKKKNDEASQRAQRASQKNSERNRDHPDQREDLPNSSQQIIKQAVDMKTQRILSNILDMYSKQKKIQPQVNRILSQHHINFEPVPHVEKPVSKKALFLGFELHFMQQFSGTKMVVTETGVLFKPYNPTLSLHAPLIVNIGQLIAAICSAFVLSRFGRKKPTLVGNFSLSIINFILAILFLVNAITANVGVIYAAFAFLIIFMIVYSLSIGPVVWPYVPEIMPARYVPYASSMNWIAAAICVIATPYIIDAVGSPYPVFFFFGGVMIIFYVINLRLLVETKGLTPTQIAAKLQK